jgi:hypothetical protein
MKFVCLEIDLPYTQSYSEEAYDQTWELALYSKI